MDVSPSPAPSSSSGASPSGPPGGPSQLELTLRAVVLGLLLAAVMGAANVYLGLKVGLTVSASIPAAVMATLVFRTLFRSTSVLEANQVQTCASAGESIAAGIIFTMPALIMIGYWETFDFWTVTAVAFSGGLLGILLMIPMRRVFVVGSPELPYPEGVACAAVLEASNSESEDSGREGRGLILGGLLGVFFKLATGLFHVIAENVEGARAAAGRIFYFGSNISPMLVAVGFIVRLNVAILLFLGGAIAWLIGIPLLGGAENYAGNLADGAWDLWSNQIRYVGVGAMVIGGISSIWTVRGGLVQAVRELRSARPAGADDHERDLPPGAIGVLALISIAIVAFVYWKFTGGLAITVLSTVIMLVMAFFFTAVASYIVGLVGNSNSPVSGMTITAVLFTGAMLWIAEFTGMEGMVATIGVAAIVCCVACTSGDVCNDLKTGSLVGASPFRQQIMQVAGVAIAALVMAPILSLLDRAYGIGSPELAAPQAQLFASLAEGFFSPDPEAALPWNRLRTGALVGIAILIIDRLLVARGSKFRLHIMPVAVGMYLPFGIAPPILVGGLIAHFVGRGSRSEQETTRRMHAGILFSSGAIAGEALTSIALAALTVAGVDLAIDIDGGLELVISLAAAAAAVFAFVVMTRPAQSTDGDQR